MALIKGCNINMIINEAWSGVGYFIAVAALYSQAICNIIYDITVGILHININAICRYTQK